MKLVLPGVIDESELAGQLAGEGSEEEGQQEGEAEREPVPHCVAHRTSSASIAGLERLAAS